MTSPFFDPNSAAVHIFCCRYDSITDETLWARYRQYLNEAEISRMERFRFTKGRQEYLIGRMLQRLVLAQVLGCEPTAIRFDTTDKGKPFVVYPDDRGWQFNLSHSHGLVVMALCRLNPIGVDIECIDRNTNTEELAPRYFHAIECEQLGTLSTSDQHHRFFDFWTLKEAFLKATGSGLSHPLDSFGFEFREIGELQLHSQTRNQSWTHAHFWLFNYFEEHPLACLVLNETGQHIPLPQLYDFTPFRSCKPILASPADWGISHQPL